MKRNALPRTRSAREKKFNRWLLAWIFASTMLFTANLINSPGFLWSLPFIILWTVILGVYAIKTDRYYHHTEPMALLDAAQEEALPELEYPYVERKWKESDFV